MVPWGVQIWEQTLFWVSVRLFWGELNIWIDRLGLPGGHSDKESARQCRKHKRHRFNPWVGRSPGEGSGNPLQYSSMENSMDREVWRATVHRSPSWTWLSDWTRTRNLVNGLRKPDCFLQHGWAFLSVGGLNRTRNSPFQETDGIAPAETLVVFFLAFWLKGKHQRFWFLSRLSEDQQTHIHPMGSISLENPSWYKNHLAVKQITFPSQPSERERNEHLLCGHSVPSRCFSLTISFNLPAALRGEGVL